MCFLPRFRLQHDFLFLFVLAAFYSLPAALAQEGQELAGPSQEDIERYDELQRLANEQRIEAVVQEDQTGTDPRSFSNKWMPFFRSQKLENGLKQYDLMAFGTVGFSPQVGMFYEVPLAQYRDFRDISGFPPGADSTVIGVGDTSLKFLVNLERMRFTFGKEGEKSGSAPRYGLRFSHGDQRCVGRQCFVVRANSGGCHRHAFLRVFRRAESLLH